MITKKANESRERILNDELENLVEVVSKRIESLAAMGCKAIYHHDRIIHEQLGETSYVTWEMILDIFKKNGYTILMDQITW